MGRDEDLDPRILSELDRTSREINLLTHNFVRIVRELIKTEDLNPARLAHYIAAEARALGDAIPLPEMYGYAVVRLAELPDLTEKYDLSDWEEPNAAA